MKIFSFITVLILLSNISSKIDTDKSKITYEVGIGPNSTKVKMLFSTSTTQNTLFSNANRKLALEIQQKRNKSTITLPVNFSEILLPDTTFNLKIDQTGYEDPSIQGEFGMGIDLYGKNDFINLLFKEKIILQKELIIGAQMILDTYLVTDKYYFGNLTDRDDLDPKYHNAWVVELSHILTGMSKKEFEWYNAEEINGRAVLDSSTKYIYIPESYINLILDIWNLNLTKCPLFDDDDTNIKSFKYIQCTGVSKDYFKDIKPIYFIVDGYGLLLTANELFENIGDDKFECLVRFRPEKNNIWTLGSPLFSKYKIWLKYSKQLIGFNGNDIINFSKEYYQWRQENEYILTKKSNDKKIVIIGAAMGLMILLTILYCLIRSCRMENSQNRSSLIEGEGR